MSVRTQLLASSLMVLLSGTAQAQFDSPTPRGPDVDSLAANCGIGPFGQVGKAGGYNHLCKVMPDGEKCLALVKGQMNEVGEIEADRFDQERAAYCLEVFKKELLIETAE
ncbi:MAG: hypothetical protein V4692_06190 [Bdellovibrionota bacterium]